MFRSLILSLALIFGTVSATSVANAADSSKVAIAPLMQVAAKSELNKAKEKFLDSKFGKDKAKLEKEVKAFQKKAQEFQKQAAALSESARKQKGQELEKEARELEKRRAEFTKKAAPVEQKVNQQILEILGDACANYAKANGYDIILDASVVLYATSAANVEEGLISEVNKLWKSKGSKFKI